MLRRVGFALLLLSASCDCAGPASPGGGDGEEGEGEDGGFNGPGAPTVTIVAPGDGSFVERGASTNFSCTAIDDVDGVIGNGSFRWNASIDGELGAGAAVQNALVSAGDQEITCFAVDGDGLVGSDTVIVHVVDALPPTVTITTPADGSFFGASQTITFAGRAVAATGAPVDNASLRWFEGATPLGVGSAVSTVLARGDHTVVLEATDADGVVGRAQVRVSVVDNVPPQCAILTPNDGAALAAGQSTRLSGSCPNPDGAVVDNAAARWSSDVDGPLGVGLSVQNALVTRGRHVITLCATDPEDAAVEGCDSINVDVGDNAAPVVTLQEPAANDSFEACRDVALGCSAVDPEGQAVTVRWFDSAGGAIPAGGFVDWRPTAGGSHVLTCTATDAQGASSSASLTVTIETPTVRIQEPGNGDDFNVGDTVTLSGDGCDAALGDLDGGQLQWRSSRDGPLGSGTQIDVDTLSEGTHDLTLTASNGAQSAIDSVRITIRP